MKTKAHLGTIKWTKIMSPFLFGYRNNISIFNMEHTIICLKQSLKILQNIKLRNGHILFVNTSPKYSALVRITASSINQSYINDRWIGGTLTNWKQVSESIFLFQKFAYQFDTFLKINNIQISNYIKAKKRYQGLRFFDPNQSTKLVHPLQLTSYNSPVPCSSVIVGEANKANNEQSETIREENKTKQTNLISNLPDIIIITNPEKNIIVLQEAKKYQIPVIGFVDSNTNNEDIQYLIPGNNQSTAFMYFCFNLFTIILKKK
jgi:small subunit ribosomal protein S2